MEIIQSVTIMFPLLFSKLRENKKTAELIKTANLLFNSFEPYYMWDYIARWFEECCRFVPSCDGDVFPLRCDAETVKYWKKCCRLHYNVVLTCCSFFGFHFCSNQTCLSQENSDYNSACSKKCWELRSPRALIGRILSACWFSSGYCFLGKFCLPCLSYICFL